MHPTEVAAGDLVIGTLPVNLAAEVCKYGAPFASLVSTAQLAVDPPTLRFDFQRTQVWCGNQAVTLPPALFAWYAWLAECRAERRGEDGFVRHSDDSPARYLAIYEMAVGRNHPSLEKARLATRHGLEPTQFEQKRSKINRQLAASLSLASAPYKVSSKGQRPYTRYGIEIAPGRILFE